MANDTFSFSPSSTNRASDTANKIAQLLSVRAWLTQLKAHLPHYGAVADGDTGANAIVSDYGLTNIGGKSFQDLVSSCADEINGATAVTFLAQLLDRSA